MEHKTDFHNIKQTSRKILHNIYSVSLASLTIYCIQLGITHGRAGFVHI